MRYFKLLILMIIILSISPSASAQMPVDAAIVQVNPPFEGVELIYSSATIFAYNEYGNYRLDVRPGTVAAAPHNILDGVVHADTVLQGATQGSIIYADATPDWNELVIGAVNTILTSDGVDVAWALPVVQTSNFLDNAVHVDTVTSAAVLGDLVIGTAGGWDDLAIGGAANVLTVAGGTATWAAPVLQTNTLLDGVSHTDTAIQAATLGSIIVADATPDWNEVVIGAAGDVLTVVGGTAAWQAPGALAGAWQQAVETTVIVAGADYTARAGAAYTTLIQDVVVVVTCREPNSGVVWNALSHPMPVASFVTFYWCDEGDGNLSVHICNDSQLDILCTVSYCDL